MILEIRKRDNDYTVRTRLGTYTITFDREEELLCVEAPGLDRNFPLDNFPEGGSDYAQVAYAIAEIESDFYSMEQY